ncbi:MAG: UDP-glucose/GDP-mannose dehydrogenase family protein [Acidobacteriota bacterium]|jgi:UDPglucose 6-dehydrogenase|nr:MAG: UDP-glucose 6-dehydrogenase [Acidobacteriota bacterium]
MKIAVIGTGYVGLVAGACFAETGHDVICVDKDSAKIRTLNRGRIPIFEPGLEEIVRRNRQRKRLAFTTSLPGAVRRSDVVFIAVGTPTGEDGSADLKYVLAAADEIGRAMNGYKVIVDKSTVPAGTAELVEQTIARRTKHPFSVVSNPEFLKEGAAVEDFLKPDRVVIGAKDEQAAELMRELYRPFTRTGAPIMVMDPVSAELSKYAANAMLATRISFMNEFANICEAFGGDIDQVRRAIGADRRIGPAFLFAGCGYGGSCFPKDVRAVIRFSAERNYRFRILEAVERVNEAQKVRLLRRVDQLLGRRLSGRRIAVWGLAFKPRTDDMREAPSIPIIRGLLDRGAKVRAFDPEAMETARAVFGRRIGYAADAYDALRRADALVIVTEWNEFREPDFERMQKMMKTPIVIDGRNIYEPERMRELGFTYASVGRP